MPLPFRKKKDNAWIEADRNERRKTVLWTLGILGFVGIGIGLLIWALVGNHH